VKVMKFYQTKNSQKLLIAAVILLCLAWKGVMATEAEETSSATGNASAESIIKLTPELSEKATPQKEVEEEEYVEDEDEDEEPECD
jgi:hypothetical protein